MVVPGEMRHAASAASCPRCCALAAPPVPVVLGYIVSGLRKLELACADVLRSCLLENFVWWIERRHMREIMMAIYVKIILSNLHLGVSVAF
jgi:hypothetical protein